MVRIETHYIKDKFLFDLTHKSKNLYNRANYIVRQEFINTSKEKEEGKREKANWIRYNDLNSALKGQVEEIFLF